MQVKKYPNAILENYTRILIQLSFVFSLFLVYEFLTLKSYPREVKEISGTLLNIEDNGVGLPKDFDILKSDTLGLQLVSTLVEQLDGEIKVTSNEGTKYLITFEKAKL